MKFKKEFLREELNPKDVIYTRLIDHSRWSLVYEKVFRFDGKYYVTIYSFGATECQDERPYEYDDDEIECDEVAPVEEVIIVYKKVGNNVTQAS